jgi:hypothetical protein
MKGGCTEELFKNSSISESTKKILVNVGNHGLAKSTWSTYGTAGRLLAMCGKDRRRDMTLPLSEDDLLEFTGWLIEVRKVKAGTINSYLSGLRQLHILKGMDPPQIRTDLMKLLVRGKKKMDDIESRKTDGVKRLPMTMNMMRFLKEKIRSWDVDIEQKLLMWTVATLAFHGAFRIHEILCKTETEFDPDFTLLTEDVRLVEGRIDDGGRKLEVKLKSPKEDKTGKAVIIEIFETEGVLCPVRAFEKWAKKTTFETGFPLFRAKQGWPLTGVKMNRWLKDRLESSIDYSKGKFTSHSFRIGLATTMGTLGYSDDDIKEAGRWSSRAFEVYMKLPRVKRAEVAKKIGKMGK